MLLDTAKSPEFWEKVRTSEDYTPLRERLLALYEADSGPIPACKYSEFILFSVTGSRKEYESSYFHRRRAMNTAAILSMLYPDNAEYFTRLCDCLWAVLDEYVWVLPAHMPTFTAVKVDHIDLFGAETGFALSEIDAILADRLPPLLRDRIRYEVDKRIIQPYLNNRYSWERDSHNWAAVCLGSVFGAFLYQRPDLIAQIRPRVEETMRIFLSGYTEDGVCLEGIGYWEYGFGFFTVFADLARDFTGGEWDYFKLPKVRAVAQFNQKVFIDGRTTISFSDSGARGSYPLGIVHYLKNEYPDDVVIPPFAYSHMQDNCGRWCGFLRSFLWFNPAFVSEENKRESHTEYSPSAGWLTKVTETYGFAAKGGTNGEPHNHNDLGSFIVSVGEKQILRDLGSGTYCKDYFRGKRYENLCASSRGHSVPIVNGQYQKAGGDRTAPTTYENGVFTAELSKGYDIPELQKLARSFGFDGNTVTLTDEWEGAVTVTERFVTGEEPQITADGIKVGPLTLRAPFAPTVNTPAPEDDTRPGKVYFIDFPCPADMRKFTLEITVQ